MPEFRYYSMPKNPKQNPIPVYRFIWVNGKRAEFSTGKDVDISKWSSELSRLKGNSEEVRIINKPEFGIRFLNEKLDNELYVVYFQWFKQGQSCFDFAQHKLSL